MRRILSILTMAVVAVVMGLVAAAPVMAQVGNEFDDQESESGGIGTETEISVQGNNNSQCAGLAQVGQSGNLSNQQGTSQYDNPESEQEFAGPEFELTPEQAAECEQEIQQAAAASSAKAAPKEEKKAEAKKEEKKEEKKAEAKPAPKEEKKAEAKPEAKKEEKKAEVKPAPKEEKKAEVKPEAKKEEKKALPKTGGSGSASLLALGAGALLVGGGLLARRIIR